MCTGVRSVYAPELDRWRAFWNFEHRPGPGGWDRYAGVLNSMAEFHGRKVSMYPERDFFDMGITVAG
jgi:hypothetical protein